MDYCVVCSDGSGGTIRLETGERADQKQVKEPEEVGKPGGGKHKGKKRIKPKGSGKGKTPLAWTCSKLGDHGWKNEKLRDLEFRDPEKVGDSL